MKSLLNVKGIKPLTRDQKQNVNGGQYFLGCDGDIVSWYWPLMDVDMEFCDEGDEGGN